MVMNNCDFGFLWQIKKDETLFVLEEDDNSAL
jgi:hypothetical protein